MYFFLTLPAWHDQEKIADYLFYNLLEHTIAFSTEVWFFSWENKKVYLYELVEFFLFPKWRNVRHELL